MLSSAKSTAYRVDLTDRANLDLDLIYESIGTHASDAADRWFRRLETAILSLEALPGRCTPTVENTQLRQILFGNKPHVYRIIYRIEATGRRVTIRHSARDRFRPQDLYDSPPSL